MNRRTIGLGLVLSLAAGGCAHETITNGQSRPKNVDAAADQPEKPLTANTHFAAGQVAESQGNTAVAIQQYQQAIKIDPKFTPAMLRLGLVYTAAKQYDTAIPFWNRYIATTNGSAAGYNDLGLCYELAGNYGEAEAAFTRGIVKEPNNEPCRVNYGLFLARQGRIDEASAQLRFVLTEAEAHYDLASVLESLGKKDAARLQYQQALQADPKFNDAKTRLAGLDLN